MVDVSLAVLAWLGGGVISLVYYVAMLRYELVGEEDRVEKREREILFGSLLCGTGIPLLLSGFVLIAAWIFEVQLIADFISVVIAGLPVMLTSMFFTSWETNQLRLDVHCGARACLGRRRGGQPLAP
jgi:hypothetical protein